MVQPNIYETAEKWIGKERSVTHFGVDCHRPTDIAMEIRKKLVHTFEGFPRFEIPKETLNSLSKYHREYREKKKLCPQSQRDINRFIEKSERQFEKDAETIKRMNIMDAEKLRKDHNLYYGYQQVVEHLGYNQLLREADPAVRDILKRDTKALLYVPNSFRFPSRYAYDSSTLPFMLLLQELHRCGIWPYKIVSSTAVLRTQTQVDSGNQGREISYSAFQPGKELTLTCANAHGFSNSRRNGFFKFVFSNLVRTANQYGLPCACALNRVDSDASDMQWIAAFDKHRFVLAGLMPLIDATGGFSREDTALKVLMRYAIQAGFHWLPEIFNYCEVEGQFFPILKPNSQ